MAQTSKIAQAYEKCQPGRDALSKAGGRCMEVTEDKKYGILWERWIVNTTDSVTSVIVYATPEWWDVFAPLTKEPKIEAVVDAIMALKPQAKAA